MEVLDYGTFLVCLIHGRVEDVIALRGYVGETNDGLRVGMSWRELLTRFPDVFCDEMQRVWRLPSWPETESELEIEIDSPRKGDERYEELGRVLDEEHASVASISVRTTSPPSLDPRSLFSGELGHAGGPC